MYWIWFMDMILIFVGYFKYILCRYIVYFECLFVFVYVVKFVYVLFVFLCRDLWNLVFYAVCEENIVEILVNFFYVLD